MVRENLLYYCMLFDKLAFYVDYVYIAVMINRRNPCKANSLIETPKNSLRRGFTLIEISIVLVIIGLITGGILVGQDLIKAAQVRSTISQIEKYNTAVNTFRGKYGGLPGDLAANLVTQFGFTVVPTRAGTAGRGDGNGLVDGRCYNGCSANGPDNLVISGEAAFFWEDLSANSGMIDGNFNYADDSGVAYSTLTAITRIPALLPEAKIGNGNYIAVYASNNNNYFAIENPVNIDNNGTIGSPTAAKPGLTVTQAYAIDKKVDDGLPQSGRVTAHYVNWAFMAATHVAWAAGGGVEGANTGSPSYAATTSSTAGTSTTCYDNNSGSGVMQYSTGQSGGSNINCALSFQFQ